MPRLFVMFAALACAAPAAAQSVEVASGNWTDIPRISAKQFTPVPTSSIDRMVDIVGSGTCKLEGQTKSNIDLTVRFLIHFEPSGTPARIVIARMNCPELERLMGGVVLQLARAGEFKPTGENPAGWYRSDLSFLVR